MKKLIYIFVLLLAFMLVSCSSDVKVKFDSDGGTKINDVVVPETGLILEPVAPEKDGYMFLGWYLKDQKFDFSTTVTKTITLKAKWAEAVTLYLESVDGTTEFLAPKNSTTELPVPERDGYFFRGWEDMTTEEIIDSEYVFTEDMYLEAKWEKKESYTINYLYNTESLKSETTYEGDEYTPYVYELKGHTFGGWYTDTTYTKQVDFNNLSRSNFAYAKMIPNEYTVSFSHTDKTIKVTYGERFGTLPKVSVNGCTFSGWEYNGKTITNMSAYSFDEDITLDAILYTNTIFVLSGTNGTKVNYKIGDVTPYINATKAGYIFAGWYTNSSLTGDAIYVIDSEAYANKALYAKWVSSDDANNTYSTKVVEHLKDYYTSLFSDTKIYEDIAFDSVDPFYGAELTWTSSNTSAILSDGRVLRAKEDVLVDLTIAIKYGNVTETVDVSVNVKGNPYRDLSKESVIGAYVYTGTYNNRPVDDILLNTANIIYMAFVTPQEDGTLLATVDFLSKYEKFKEDALNKGVRVIASIGGANSTIFDSIAMDDYKRYTFINACLDLVIEHGFAGIDIDWEYPQQENAKYFTLLMKDLNETLKAYDKELLVTSAIPAGPWGPPKFDLKNSHQYIDYINLMSYDLQVSETGLPGRHHSALYQSTMTYSLCSVDATVEGWKKAYQMPAEKIVIGAAFYGRMSTLNRLNGTITADGDCGVSIRYNTIVSDYLSKPTVTEYWDEKAKAPYLFDTATNTFISYDNPKSIGYKCDYVNEKGVAGIFWWDYGSDSTGDLIEAVNKKLSVLEK